jgi:A/G-specific adenine glycosylase
MTDARTHSKTLLAWYDRNRRKLPWRALPGAHAEPYHVWLSEIMLQQTTVATVASYYADFVTRWPRVEDLAAAPLDDVLHAWAGLGYYARARNLHKAAKVVAERFGGRFPDNEETLLTLPGVGAYTAAAIASIAFDQPAAVMDGNVERVLSRLFRVATPLPQAKTELRRLAAELTPQKRPGDYAQAMMDLGATLCSPRKPACGLCPLFQACAAAKSGDPDSYPVKLPKAERPTRRGFAYWTIRGDGMVLLRRRPETGLLGGMVEVPSSRWLEGPLDAGLARGGAPLSAQWRTLDGLVAHTFTHFHLELTVLAAKVRLGDPKLGIWTPLDKIGDYALPTLFRKVARHALRQA